MHLGFHSATPEHQRPLPHAGFGPKRRRQLPHSVISTVLCISSLIRPLLTVFPLPPSWQITPLPLEFAASRLPPPNTAARTRIGHLIDDPSPRCVHVPTTLSGCRATRRRCSGCGPQCAEATGELPPVVPPRAPRALRCWHGPARPVVPLGQAEDPTKFQIFIINRIKFRKIYNKFPKNHV
jgi:hypothetical protein